LPLDCSEFTLADKVLEPANQGTVALATERPGLRSKYFRCSGWC
jgi:hypothetical protein